MLVKKVTTGFVIQVYDTEKKRMVSQSFVDGDEVWETNEGEHLEANEVFPNGEPELPIELVQPSLVNWKPYESKPKAS